MLTYKEFKKLRQNENNNVRNVRNVSLETENIEKAIDNLTSEVVGYIISEKRFNNFVNFCEGISDFGNKWKTIQEHRMVQQLPSIIKETLEEECLSYRLLINDAKIEIKKTLKEANNLLDPWAQLQNREKQASDEIERKVDQIFSQLKTDLLNQYGVNRGVQPSSPSPAAGPQAAQPYSAPRPTGGDFELGDDIRYRKTKKPGLWQRTKNWLKSVWHGATGGDPNLRKYALEKGYADSPHYSKDPNAYKDTKKFPQYFEHVEETKIKELEQYLKEDFEEARNTFHGIFGKYKKEILNLVAQYALKVFSKDKPDEPDEPEGPETEPKGPEPTEPEPEGPEPDNDKGEEEEPKGPSGFEDAIAAPQKIEKPDKVGILANSRDIDSAAIKKAWDTKIDHGDNKYTFTINYNGKDYTFTPEQQRESKKYITFKKDGIRIQITKNKWDRSIEGEEESKLPEEKPKDNDNSKLMSTLADFERVKDAEEKYPDLSEYLRKNPDVRYEPEFKSDPEKYYLDKIKSKEEKPEETEDTPSPEEDESMPQPKEKPEETEDIPSPEEDESMPQPEEKPEETEDTPSPEEDESMPQPEEDDEEAEVKKQPKSKEETGTSSDYSKQSGFGEIDPDAEDNLEDDEDTAQNKIIDAIDKHPELADLLQKNPDLWSNKEFKKDPEQYYLNSKKEPEPEKEIEPESKSEESPNEEKSNYYGFSDEELPENVLNIIDDPSAKAMSSKNLKNVKKDDNGNLEFASHGKSHPLTVVYNKGTNRVYFYYPLSSKNRYNVKFMEKDKFNEFMEDKDINVPTIETKPSEPEKTELPETPTEPKKHYDINDVRSVGKRGLDRL